MSGFDMEQLTPDNLIVCMDEYLRKLQVINKETAIDLMLYLTFAISTKDFELIRFAHNRIICYLISC